jgi:hypothetical protein
MDETEEISKRFLESEGHSDILYEPEGDSTTPDFSINGDTAVEVTLLQINEWDHSRIPSLRNILNKAISKCNKKSNVRSSKYHKGKSYFLRLLCDYDRIPTVRHDYYKFKQKIKHELEKKLDYFIKIPFKQQMQLVIDGCSFSLEFREFPYDKKKLFIEIHVTVTPEKLAIRPGYISTYIRSAAIEKKEKMVKALPSQSRYKKKWLLLLDPREKTPPEFNNCDFSDINYWDRIVVIDRSGKILFDTNRIH